MLEKLDTCTSQALGPMLVVVESDVCNLKVLVYTSVSVEPDSCNSMGLVRLMQRQGASLF